MTTFFQFNDSLFVPSSWILPDTIAAGDIGQVLTEQQNATSFETPLDNILLYRNHSVTLGIATPWMAQWYSNGGFSSAANSGRAVALRTGTLRWLRAAHANPLSSSDVLTYVVVVNDIDTSLTVSLNANSSGPALNSVDTVAVNAGDLINVRCNGLTATRALRMSVDFFLD